jgi:phosphohistidine swiveling domain-containing protein
MPCDPAESVAIQHLNAVLAHRCSSRLLSIEAELVGVARHRDEVPGCGAQYMMARRREGLWEVAEAGDGLEADARLGLEVVLHSTRLGRHAAHEARARDRFAAASTQAGALDARASSAHLRAAFVELFDAYADFLAAYRLTNERFWSTARSWLESELDRASGDPQVLADLLWIDMSDTATARESRAWEELARRAGPQPGVPRAEINAETVAEAMTEAICEHARAFGHLFGDQVFSDVDVPARLWQRLRDGQLARGRSTGEIAAMAERRERTLARLDLGQRARTVVEAMRALALLRLRMREHMLLCNARTRGFFELIAGRMGLGAVERPLLRFLSQRDIARGLAGDAPVDVRVLESRRRSGMCELLGSEVRVWSIAEAPRATPAPAGPRQIQGQVVQAGPVVIGHAVRVARLEDIDEARAAAGPGPHILVVPMLHPAMMVAASSFAAVLAAEGGLLSHAAMLAREYRIPCITGLRDLAGLAETGRRIIVDPTRGSVELAAPDDDRNPRAAGEADPRVPRDSVAWTRLGGAGELMPDRFGGKASMLQRMFATLPIPDGLCLSSDATRKIADWDSLCPRLFADEPGRHELSAAEQRFVDDWFEQVAKRWSPPEELRAALRALGACVVRSSSVEEDRPGSSSAGLLTSVPSAEPLAELPAALATVLRSALSPAYLRYRKHRSLAGPPPCPALLIQRRIPCVASGVLTTWRPAGAAEGRLTVAMAPGFGGSESPRQLVLGVDLDAASEIEVYQAAPTDRDADTDAGTPVEVRLEAHGISRTGVRALCSLAAPVRRAGLEHFELEWCLDQAQRPFVVQVRDRRSEHP